MTVTDAAAEPDLSRTAVVYSDRSSRLCVELSEEPDSVAGWCWAGSEFKPADNVWNSLDGWLALTSTGD